MALSYRACLRTGVDDAHDVVRDVLERHLDDFEQFGHEAGDATRFRAEEEGDPQAVVTVTTVAALDENLVIIERQHPLAVQEVQGRPAPTFVPDLIERLDARIGALRCGAPIDDQEVERWVDESSMTGQAVLLVTDEPSSMTRVFAEVTLQLSGMAAIGYVPPATAELCLRALGRPGTINPGALIHLSRRLGEFDGSVVPATAVAANPASAVRRNHRLCLTWQALEDLPEQVKERLRSFHAPGATPSTLDDAWFQEFELLEGRLATMRGEREVAWLELDEALRELDRTRARLAYTEARLREHEAVPIFEVDDDFAEPDSCVEAVTLARELLSNLEIRGDDRLLRQLDEHEKSLVWAGKLWAALRALNSYALFRLEREFNGSFLTFCDETPLEGIGYFANSVAMQESESTGQNPATRQARTFSVPESVARGGRAYMPAHVKIDQRGSPAPRIHFYDDTARGGKVYVGYIGPHLPTGG